MAKRKRSKAQRTADLQHAQLARGVLIVARQRPGRASSWPRVKLPVQRQPPGVA